MSPLIVDKLEKTSKNIYWHLDMFTLLYYSIMEHFLKVQSHKYLKNEIWFLEISNFTFNAPLQYWDELSSECYMHKYLPQEE